MGACDFRVISYELHHAPLFFLSSQTRIYTKVTGKQENSFSFAKLGKPTSDGNLKA